LHRFSDYELLEEIARGGMGVIYRARQLSLNRIVALKMILGGQFAGNQEVLRFRSEAEAAAHLQHPNIVRIHETGEHDGHRYFSMDYVEGRTLAELVRDAPLPAQRAAKYTCKIAEAIHYAHLQGILHRDLKPSNIIIDKNDEPLVTDFGLAKRMRHNFGVTVTGQVLGTPNFMPPEQTSARSGEVGPGSDVYALGGILYYLLTARPPFQAESLDQVITQVLNAEPISPRLLNPSVPRDLETITLKCLEKETSRRYQSAQDLADELGRFQRREPIHARPITAPERLWRWSRRKPVLALLIMLLLVVGTIGLTGILWQWRRAEHHAERAEARAYASDMNLSQQALAANNLGRAAELLNRYRPLPGETNRCGWEWRYLWQETQGDHLFTLCQKPVSIFSLAVSPDARLLAVGERNMGHLALWDLQSRQQLVRLPDEDRPDILYIRVAFSPTEPLLAYGSASGATNEQGPHMVCRLRVWNYQTRQHVAEFALDFLCSGLAFSPKGDRLLTSTLNSLTLWDVRTREKLKTYPLGSHQGIGTPFSITPDFRLVAQAFGRGRVRVFDLTTGTTLWQTNASTVQVEAVALSSDGELLATADAGDKAVLQIWSARDGRLISRLEQSAAGAIQLLFTPDNRALISANTDQTIRVWDVSNLQNVPPPRLLIGHTLEVWRLALLPDGKTLISGGKDGSVRFWDLTHSPRRRGGIALSGGPFVGWSFAGSESDLVTCDRQGRVARWSGEEWQTMTLLRETGRSAQMACLLPDRQEVVIAGSDGALRVHRWQDSEPPRELSVFPKATWIWCLHRHGSRLAVGRLDQPTIHDFDVETWQLKESWRAPVPFKAMEFSPDARYCVMATGRGQVTVRNMLTGEESSFRDGLPNIGSVAFSTAGDRVGISTAQGFVGWWQSGSWRDAGRLSGFLRDVNGLAFSADGQRLAVGSSGDEAIRLYETKHYQPLVSLQAQGTGFSPAFDSSGNVLTALSAEGKLYVWRAPSMEEIEIVETSANRLSQH
jgi:WD40 repeat protein/predicted Ser/Thr protein kinase